MKKSNERAPQRRKRGIILLIVISLLALFVLIAVTYAILASNFLSATKQQIQRDRVGDHPEREFDIVLSQVLYDTLSRTSLQGHSLLADLHGRDFIFDTGADGTSDDDTRILSIANPTWGVGQVFGFHVSGQALQANGGLLSPILDYYAGRLLTFTEGPAENYCSRILQYDPTHANGPQFIIELDYSAHTTIGAPVQGNHFVINGAPFNGTGAGYSVSSGTYNLDATYTPSGGNPYSIALLPHFAGYDAAGTVTELPDLGGFDESWDAVDFQNMWLAMVPPSAAQRFFSQTAPYLPIIPSYHRPELVNYWAHQLDPTSGQPDVTQQGVRDLLRAAIFRPMPWDHPKFTGSNPNFVGSFSSGAIQNAPGLLNNLIHGHGATTGIPVPLWDVDNDGDGFKDSIWIDPGLPVVTSPSGKRYKRLVSILIKDLDGRIDLNAHGNLTQTSVMGSGTPNNYRADTALSSNWGLATTGIFLPRGLGFGPAEVDFRHILSDSDAAYSSLLLGRYFSNVPSSGDSGTSARPGILFSSSNPIATQDPLPVVKHHGIPDNYTGAGFWYASPPDVWGRGAVVLDYGGQPLYGGMGQASEMRDAPYEISLSGEYNNSDSPYALVEIERLLRQHDSDAQGLYCRPIAYVPALAGTPGVANLSNTQRELLAGRTSSLPVPGTSVPRAQRGNVDPRYATILDLYRYKLQAGGATNINQEMTYIVPWEIRQGGKFNLNRWLGDGLDSNGDNTPDDPGEALAGEYAWQAPAGFTSIVATHSNGITYNALNRQLYARHLFCLAMLFLDPNFQPATAEAGLNGTAQNHNLFIRRLAQWAVNCVDFRDSDSIMTPFEFDYDPWDGWNADGIIGGTSTDDSNPNRGLVWGVEHPELLITETLAFHDRRVKDTMNDTGTPPMRRMEPNAAMRDNDVDQFRVPEGSLFVELYCPRPFNFYTSGATGSQKPRMPRELYDITNYPDPRLDLSKRTLTGWPVWRLAISPIMTTGNSVNPLHPNAPGNPQRDSVSFDVAPNPANLQTPNVGSTGTVPIERYVWFTSQGSVSGTVGSDGVLAPRSFYFSGTNTMLPLLQPGQYALVAPRLMTYLGAQDPANANPMPPATSVLWGGNSPQVINMNNAVPVTDFGGAPLTYSPPTNIRNLLPIIADRTGDIPTSGGNPWSQACPWPIGLNISEPLPSAASNYYPEPQLTVAVAGSPKNDFYGNPDQSDNGFLDEPLETPGSGYPIADHGMIATGTYTNCAAVYLQRLANPLQTYDPGQNPYLTVDWASIDLTVFTGEENTNQMVPNAGMANANIDPNDDPGSRPTMLFHTRQRGQLDGIPPTGTPLVNPWPPATNTDATASSAVGPGNVYFRYLLDSTSPTPSHTFGYVNSTISTPMASPTGEPSSPFPWLAWHNRPFANAMELLCVPASAPSRLCTELSLPTTATGTNPYDNSTVQNFRLPFLHLLNFFTTDGGTPPNAPQLFGLLDFVEVPSPYAGAEKWFNPSQFYNSPATHLYQPPFNKMSRFRDPGRININTIFDENVWIAATGNFPGMNNSSAAQLVFRSRQGYGGGNWYDANSALPTLFANPFRPADTADLMPSVGSPTMRRTNPVEVTMLRPDPNTASKPLFELDPSMPDPTTGNGQGTELYRDIRRNAYFRHQPLQKLGSVFTTHSNCFAVWMTVGYFEVEPTTSTAPPGQPTAACPDGYQLGQEIGFDTGEITRHREFYLIDRSVPVGFMPGQKLNALDCVLLRRFIE